MYEGAYGLDATVIGIPFYSFDLHNLLFNLKFILPIRRFEPYFILGFGAQSGRFIDELADLINTSRWDFALRPEFGLDFYLSENWSINGLLAVTLRATDYGDLGKEPTDNATITYGLGAQYHF